MTPFGQKQPFADYRIASKSLTGQTINVDRG